MTTQPTADDPASAATADDEGYRVRPFESGDEPAVLALGGPQGDVDRDAWFDWWCRANPALDHVPMAVVERDGEIVAAQPFLAVRVRAGEREAIALSPDECWTALGHGAEDDAADLASLALDGAIEYYTAAALDRRPPTDVDVVTGGSVAAETEAVLAERGGVTRDDVPAFFFTFRPTGDHANEGEEETETVLDDVAAATEVDAREARGWEPRSEAMAYHRIQRPGAFVAARIPGPAGRAVGWPFTALGGRLKRARDPRVTFETDDYVVMHQRGVPAATLAACYERSRPASTHPVLDEQFFDWWYARPDIDDVETYVVYRGSEGAAAIVIYREAERTNGGVDALTIGHVLPVTGDPQRPDAVAAGMDRLLAEHADAGVIRTSNPLIPHAVLTAYGFRRGDTLPTSLLVDNDDRTLHVRPVVAGEWSLGSRPIGEAAPFLWTLGEASDQRAL